jgi:hypothetical protein
LGRWEQAKGQLPLSPDARTAHLRFLQAVAYFLHSNEERTAKPDRVLAIARFFYERAGNVSPAELVEDCIRRDVLARDVEGSIGLGHLTYQEYLTACWLRDRNEAEFLWTRLRTPWWEKVLQFYAAETKDLTGVVKAGRTFSRNGLEVGIVRHLLQYAPYTSKSVVEQLEREPISSKGRDITTVRTPTIELD